jgi:hypothetical protein
MRAACQNGQLARGREPLSELGAAVGCAGTEGASRLAILARRATEGHTPGIAWASNRAAEAWGDTRCPGSAVGVGDQRFRLSATAHSD